jgi:hypothetical protein
MCPCGRLRRQNGTNRGLSPAQPEPWVLGPGPTRPTPSRHDLALPVQPAARPRARRDRFPHNKRGVPPAQKLARCCLSKKRRKPTPPTRSGCPRDHVNARHGEGEGPGEGESPSPALPQVRQPSAATGPSAPGGSVTGEGWQERIGQTAPCHDCLTAPDPITLRPQDKTSRSSARASTGCCAYLKSPAIWDFLQLKMHGWRESG